ncbi:GspMb/PilO family protein [Aquincola sp. MAHUQ-54]|uniref:GspMb/PilO family protein n=1 Tax=Aquincola agrisoli TaxID=3119538 RepID=A0AAW9Q7Q8_9BURK
MKAMVAMLGRRLGPFGAAGLVLLAAALGWALLVLRPLQAEHEGLQQQALALEARLQSGRELASAPASAGEQLAAFHAFFPRADASTPWLARIHAAAAANGVALASAEYRVERRPEQPLLRYTLTLPLTGTYAELRGFVGTVLAEVPAAAIDDIQLRRENAGSATLEARIRLSLYLRER